MDRLEKFLKKLRPKELEAMLLLIQQLKKDYRKIPGIQPLKGKKNWFRIRLGRYRILFEVTKTGSSIKRITKRDESTYRDL